MANKVLVSLSLAKRPFRVNSTNEWHHGQAASGASGASGVTLMAAAAGGNKKGQIHLIERRHPIRPQLNMFLAMSSTKFLFYISD